MTMSQTRRTAKDPRPALEFLEARLLLSRTELAAVSSAEVQGDSRSLSCALSADGKLVAFNSFSTNLVSGDTNDAGDVFIRNRRTGATSRISLKSNGAQANGASYGPDISGAGRYVAFVSSATNLVNGDTNGEADIFVHDRQTHTTRRVSVRSNGSQANDSNSNPTISADGRYVAFYSVARNLVNGDTNGQSDIFVYDLQTETIQCVSVNAGGTQANDWSRDPALSADGRYVTFYSAATNLVPGDTNGQNDVFVYDRQDQTIERVSVRSNGAQGNGFSGSTPTLSADGRYVAFASGATNLVNGDTNGKTDAFVYDRQKGQLKRVSVGSNGSQALGGNTYAPCLSGDGKFVAYYSHATNLVAGDTNAEADIFVYNRTTRVTRRISISTGGAQGDGDSWEPAFSANGRCVGFDSDATTLVAGDANGFTDVFVRVL